jgi:Zn-dependent protease with chaperone function
MKWIQAQTEKGWISLALDHQGILFAKSTDGAEVALGSSSNLIARLHDGKKTAVILLPEPWGEARTTEIDVVDAWFSHLDLSGERRRKPTPVWIWAWGILGGIVIAIVLTFTVFIPWAAGSLAERVPVSWETDLADGTLKELASDGFSESKLSSDEIARKRKMFAELVKLSKYPLPIRLEFYSWNAPNAFAIPGGVVVITDQMLDLMKTDDEFLAVMAHEIGHLEHRHGVRSVIQDGSSWLVISLMFGDASSMAALTTALPAVLVTSAYSRDFEREADVYAFNMLRSLGKSPQAFATVMRELQKANEEAGGLSYFSSHPPTNERIEAAEVAAR